MTLKNFESPGYLALCRGPTLHFLSGSARCLMISLSQMKMIAVIVVSMMMTIETFHDNDTNANINLDKIVTCCSNLLPKKKK